jgi:hypothetical protein
MHAPCVLFSESPQQSLSFSLSMAPIKSSWCCVTLSRGPDATGPKCIVTFQCWQERGYCDWMFCISLQSPFLSFFIWLKAYRLLNFIDLLIVGCWFDAANQDRGTHPLSGLPTACRTHCKPRKCHRHSTGLTDLPDHCPPCMHVSRDVVI